MLARLGNMESMDTSTGCTILQDVGIVLNPWVLFKVLLHLNVLGCVASMEVRTDCSCLQDVARVRGAWSFFLSVLRWAAVILSTQSC